MKLLQLISMSVLWTCACTPLREPASDFEGPSREPDPTVRIELDSNFPLAHCDVFLFEISGLKKLVAHCRTTDTELEIQCPEGDYSAVAIANFPGEFNDSAIPRFDALEGIRYLYSDDDCDCPVQSAVEIAGTGRSSVLELEPLLCRIELRSIESEVDLRRMRIWLENVNAEAELLRWSNFHIGRMLNCGALVYDDYKDMRHRRMLVRNIDEAPSWRYTFYPKVSLWCYPNDSDDGLGSAVTVFVLQGFVGDDMMEYRYPLPPLRRNCREIVDLRMHSLAGCDGNHLVDIIHRTAAAEVVDGACDSLKDGSDSLGAT